MKNSVFVGREFLSSDTADASRATRRCVSHPLAILLTCVFAFLAVPWSCAQTGGALAGEVSDTSKSVLTGVAVTATSTTTGQAQTVTTNESGLYRFPLLTPGSYEVTFTLSGFKALRAKATVVVSETATLDIVLPVGGVNEQVSVTAADNSALLQTDTSTLGRVVDEKTVQEVPLSTRNFTQLMTLSPGTSSNINNAGSLGRGTQTIYANGARAVSNSLTIDGIDAINIHSNGLAENSVSSNGVAVPSPEAIQEFKVQTGMYDAQYGRNGGANTALVTRTGTSRFHGSMDEFFRNDALNANTFLFRQNGTKRAVLKQNQFGASLGGPVIAEKMFFFASYQGTRQVNGLAGSKTLSLPSGLYGSTRTAAALGAAYGGKTGSNGGLAIANDGSNISPVALSLLNYKLPNGQYVIPGPQSAATSNNYSVSIPSRYIEDQWVATIDHSFSASNHFTVRGLLANQPQFNSFTTATVPGFGQTQDFKSRAFNLTDVHVFSSHVVNEAHAGLMRIMGALGVENVISIGSIGMSRFNSSIFNNIPTIAVSGSSGTFTLGYSTDGNQAGHQNTFQYTDTVSVIEGKHSLRIGAELRRYQDNYNTYNRTLGTITLYSFPDFLLGRSSGSVASGGNGLSTYGALSNASVASNIGVRNDRLTDYTLFVQDDWKVTRKLTVNAGLRWDRYGSGVDQGGRNGNFVPSLYTAPPSGGYTSAGFVQSANARKLLNGVPTVNPRLLNHEMWKNFAPRIGFSYQALSSIVIRGGYGIFFDRLSNQISLRTALAPPNYIKSDLSGTNANGASLANPFPTLPLPSALPTTPLLPDPFTFPASSLLATNAVDSNMGMPYMHQYVGNIQWEARKSLLVELGYVGSKGVKLPNQMYINQARIATASNPVNGVTTTTTASANLAQRVPFLGMSPNGLTYLMTNTDSRYNSLQVSVTKRLSHGLQFLASYTYSRSIDDSSGSTGSTFVNSDGDQLDVHQATGKSDFDRPSRFIINYIYDVPYLGYHLRRNGFTNALLAEWQLTGVTTLQDGSPFDLTDANGAAYYGTGTSRASFASGKTIADAKKDGSVTSRYKAYFNTSTFATAGNYYGNVPRNALRGPGQTNWDFAALKSFQLLEGVRFQFRSEFFNVFNHTNFANPSSAISSSSSFGVISSIIGNPRVIQFAGKVTF
jgi:outer membrane receptor protein involved in Fe transport